MEPQELGEFRIEGKLGQGAMGAVYRAHQTSLGRTVALKVLPPHFALNPEFIARFKNEAMAAATLNHPHIVQIYAAGESDGTHFFAMEFVDGETLGTRVERKGRLDPREAVAVAVYVARALDHAWKRAQVIHRDIKPDNIFLSREGEVKLGDLGLAKSLDAQAAAATQTGTSMGTPYYVSPEQARGDREIDFRADIYSLGCTLFHILSGVTPYQGDSAMGVMLQHLTQPPPEIAKVWPECPPPIIGLLERMLRKDAGARHQSYEELLEDLMWVSAKLDEPDAIPAPAISMIVPAPKAVTGTGKPTAPTVVPTTRSRGVRYGVIGSITAAILIGVLLWAPWKKPTNPIVSSGVSDGSLQGGKNGATEEIGKSSATPVPVSTPATPEPAQEVTKAAPPVSTGAANASEGFVPLFNGTDLKGWRGGATFDHRKLLAMSASDRATQIATWTREMLMVNPKTGKSHWYVENGELVNDGAGGYATTESDYGDFELRLEYKTVPLADSGVYLRGVPQVQIWDYTDTSVFKLGADKGSGGLWNNSEGSPGKYPAVRADKPFGQWNQLRILMVGPRVSVWLNDQKVVDDAALENNFDRSQPIPTHGPIQLQTRSREIRWRNILIRPVGSAAVVARPAESAESGDVEAGFASLFNGRDLTGWEGDSDHWSVKDGVISGFSNGVQQGATFLIWQGGELADFELRLRARLSDGNSGVQFRSRRPYGMRIIGYQADIVSKPPTDLTQKWWFGSFVNEGFPHVVENATFAQCGQRTEVTEAGRRQTGTTDQTLPQLFAGFRENDWNDYRIVAQGNQFSYYINGNLNAEFTDKHPAFARTGILALQLRHPLFRVDFKDIRIQHLGAGASNRNASQPAAISSSPPAIEWQKTYGGRGSDILLSLQPAKDGGYFLAGNSDSPVGGNKTSPAFGSYDWWVIRVGANGTKLWERSLGGTGDDSCNRVLKTGDGGCIVVGACGSGMGSAQSGTDFGGRDAWLVWLGQDGRKLREKSFGGSGTDGFASVLQTADGGYVLIGYSASPIGGNKSSPNFGDSDGWIIRLDARGEKLWDHSYGGSMADEFSDACELPGGEFVVVGTSTSPPSGNKISRAFGNLDVWVLRLDSKGRKIWEQSYGGDAVDRVTRAPVVSGGDLILAGFSQSSPGAAKSSPLLGAWDWWVLRLDGSGNKRWERSYGGSGREYCWGVVARPGGGFYFAGNSQSAPGNDKTAPLRGRQDGWLMLIDDQGNRLWDESLGEASQNSFYTMALARDGGLILGGNSQPLSTDNKSVTYYGSNDFWLVKLRP